MGIDDTSTGFATHVPTGTVQIQRMTSFRSRNQRNYKYPAVSNNYQIEILVFNCWAYIFASTVLDIELCETQKIWHTNTFWFGQNLNSLAPIYVYYQELVEIDPHNLLICQKNIV
jgi:hypothetical protein